MLGGGPSLGPLLDMPAEEDTAPLVATGWPVRVAVLAFVSALNNVAFGYDVGVISGSLSDMAASIDLSTIQQEAVTSGLNYVAGLGALLLSGNSLDRLGRRITLLLSALLLVAGAVVVAAAMDFPTLLVGRALQGLGSGCSWSACSLYITEIAPARYRGALVAIADIAINAGILVGYAAQRLVFIATPDPDTCWRVAMGLSAVVPLLFCVLGYPAMPESPRWLVMRGREAEARDALLQLSGGGSARQRPASPTAAGMPTSTAAGVANNAAPTAPARSAAQAQVEAAAARVQAEAESEADRVLAEIAAAVRGTRELSWSESVLPAGGQARRLVLLAVALGLAQQLTGTEAILYYTPAILNECKRHEREHGCTSPEAVFVASLGVGFCKLIGELVAAVLVERTGRRRTMSVSNLQHASPHRPTCHNALSYSASPCVMTPPFLIWQVSNLLLSLGVFAIAAKFAFALPTSFGAAALSLVMLFFSLGTPRLRRDHAEIT
jgi:MFS family permease